MDLVSRLSNEELAEMHLLEIKRWIQGWRELMSLPGVGPDMETDLAAIVVSSELANLFFQVEHGDGSYWDHLCSVSPVPLVSIVGLRDYFWTALLRADIDELYDQLAAGGWFPGRGRPEGLN